MPSVVLESLRYVYADIYYVAMHIVPKKWYLKWQFKKCVGYQLNLDNPQTFNEKLQWLKLHDRNPLYTKMVDKYEAKKYVANIIGEEYIIPTLGVWNNFDEIDFDDLPAQFVLKCTHDSGSVVICPDKKRLNKEAARKKLSWGLRHNFYYHGGFEWPYKNVKPRIIAEKFMVDEYRSELIDYKLMCFNGKVRCSFTCTRREKKDELRVTFYDRTWKKLPFERHYPAEDMALPKPDKYEEMIQLAEKIASNLRFARIDFYEINNNIYFGEITFYPGDGFEEFSTMEWDMKMGNYLKL